MFDFIKNISPTELILIGVIVTVLFGPKVVAMFGKTGGETFREIKKIKSEFTKAVGGGDNSKPSKN